MKIIHLILGKANPLRMNGVNKVVNNLATTQAQLGHEVEVWGIATNLELNYPERNYVTRLFLAPSFPWGLPSELKQRLTAMKDPCVVHIHGGFIPRFFVASKLLDRLKIPYVLTPHGAYNDKAMEKSKWVKKVYFQLFERRLIEHAQSLHVIGKSEWNTLQQRELHPNGVLIPNGQILPQNQKDYKLKNRKHPVFTFCGRIDIETKGLDILLQAFELFTRQGLQAELWIIGDGAELPKLKELAQSLGLDHRVTFHGMQTGDAKNQLLLESDVFFHPSRNEGLPGAVLEAAGFGVPCVVSQESNMADYINQFKAGAGLHNNNSKNLAQSMKQMQDHFANGSLEKLGENARQMVRKAFDWSSISEQLFQVYRAAL
ncbi:glycosyltransferase [bacterium SCSIO 12741]|nr:glycosyltransferase [bacterium SCSIO 12741]